MAAFAAGGQICRDSDFGFLTQEGSNDIIIYMDTIKELYSPEEFSRLKRKIKRERVWVLALPGLTLALCVLFCCLTTTANAEGMALAAIGTSTVGGWLTIYRRLFGLQEARHELEHARHLADAPREQLRGRLTVTKEKLRIKNSIRIRVLLLDDGKQQRRLKVNETRVRQLQELDGKEVVLALAGSFVAGIGGVHADC